MAFRTISVDTGASTCRAARAGLPACGRGAREVDHVIRLRDERRDDDGIRGSQSPPDHERATRGIAYEPAA